MATPFDTTITPTFLRPYGQVFTDPGAANKGLYNPTDAPNFIPRLSEACDQLHDAGLFKGVSGEVYYNGAPNGYVTLPRRYESIIGATVGTVPTITFSQGNQFKDMGLGWRKPTQYTQIGFTDMGDGYCTQIDIDPNAPSIIQIGINVADAGKKIMFFGEDADFDTIYDESGDPATGSEGITFTTTFPTYTSSQVFSSIQRVMPQSQFKYPVTLSAIINGVMTQIARYEPGETPQYRRYKTGIIQPKPVSQSETGNAVRVFCKRRFIPILFETDLVFPGAQRALVLALQALSFEKDMGDIGKANKFWDEAIANLNSKIKSARQKQQLTVPFRLGYPTFTQTGII